MNRKVECGVSIVLGNGLALKLWTIGGDCMYFHLKKGETFVTACADYASNTVRNMNGDAFYDLSGCLIFEDLLQSLSDYFDLSIASFERLSIIPRCYCCQHDNTSNRNYRY